MNMIDTREWFLYYLIANGYVTLQTAVSTDYPPNDADGKQIPAQEIIQIPEDWINELRCDNGYMRPCIGRESGFTFFTERGYIACKDRIKEAFLDAFRNGRSRGTTPDMTEDQVWAVFDNYAQDHFKKVTNSIAKFQKKIEKQLDDANKLVA